ncbi:hypothetical protein [Ottowia sp. SB7-C50]|jgi:hypothetical protein|uniref:hypothetical protein n=1 Tax=Ottowia sp. SB7-C50 TaxID=3081231 RepID=UPI002952C734|nr:hypothetical protein [Ottowia sp. SB7-C50]WOP14239.1 hypothetical protein R0D99_10105 [Ottowia sp. SB7-C50]
MKTPLLTLCYPVAAAVLAGAALPAAAQDRIYRCGNEYTNQIKGRSDCKVVEGGNVTVVRGTVPAAAAPAPAPATRSAAAAPSAARAPGSAPAAAPRIDTPEQRARDADAKAILEQELRRAESRQAELVKDYNNGEPDKIGGEARNYQKYLDRVAEMKASIARNQSDIEGIRRELGRFK